MLTYLSIKNYALIDHLAIDFSDGFTAFTGETGAGKSILLGALSLVLGERVDSEFFRDQTQPIGVEASFLLKGQAHVCACLAAVAGVDITVEDECIIRREIFYQGKNKCFINGHMVSVGVLKQVGTLFVDVHGQHDHQLLFAPEWHSVFLDDFGTLDADVVAFKGIFEKWNSLKNLKHGCMQDEADKLREMDVLKFQINEIEVLSLVDGEESALESERILLKNSTVIKEHAGSAYDGLYGGEGAALEQLNNAIEHVKELGKIDPSMQGVVDALERAYVETEEAALSVQKYSSSISDDDGRIEEIFERLDAISKLKKKYGKDIAEILIFLANARQRYDALAMNEEQIAEYDAEIEALEGQLQNAAKKMHSKRVSIAKKLSFAIEEELKDLAMADAYLEIVVQKGAFNERGYDTVEFMISTNKGEAVKPLRKIASGGEAARIMLAFKKILAHVDQVGTIVFDEIDANIGGRLAKKVGEKIKEIAEERQVLLITHLPQIASFADAHLKVVKVERDARSVTTCVLLEGDERVRELAHMLSGPAMSDIALQHAKELMNAAEVS